MNEQANKILVELLQKAANGIDAAVTFSQAQIPDVVHQLLVWNSVSSILVQIFILSFIGVYVLAVYKFYKITDSKRLSEGALVAGIFSLATGALFAIGLAIASFSYFDWLKIWLAPKLYLLEYAASLIK